MMKAASWLILLFLVHGCAVVLGPPESEGDMPPPLPFITPDIVIEGIADPGMARSLGGFFAGKTGNTWQVMMVSQDRTGSFFTRNIFSGRVLVEGGFLVDVEGRPPLPPDDLRFRGNSAVFRYELASGSKGFRFMVQPTGPDYCITLDFALNGMSEPRVVRLGRSMTIPDTLPVRLCVRSR